MFIKIYTFFIRNEKCFLNAILTFENPKCFLIQGCIFYVNILHFPIFVSLIFSRYSTFSYKQRSFFQRFSQNCQVFHCCDPYFGLNRGKHNNLPRFRTKLIFFSQNFDFSLEKYAKKFVVKAAFVLHFPIFQRSF